MTAQSYYDTRPNIVKYVLSGAYNRFDFRLSKKAFKTINQVAWYSIIVIGYTLSIVACSLLK